MEDTEMKENEKVSKFEIELSLLTERLECSHLFESVPN